MKFGLLGGVLLAGLSAAVLLASDKKDSTTCESCTTAPTTQASKTPVNKLCPIGKEAVDKSITTEYKGKTIAFCCESCIAKFKADPEKYMADLK